MKTPLSSRSIFRPVRADPVPQQNIDPFPEANTRGPAPDLDPEVLAGLADDVGEEVVPQLMRVFHADLQLSHQRGRAAVAAQDAGAFVMVMHSLRGQCPYFGAMPLAAIAGHYELAARAGNFELVAAWAALEPRLLSTTAAVAAITENADGK